MKKLLIIGASGHGKAILDVANASGEYAGYYFFDDDESVKEVLGVPVIGKTSDVTQYCPDDFEVIVAIGNSKIRQRQQEMLEQAGYHIATLIHPSAYIGLNAFVGAGSVVMAQAVVGVDARIGKGCIVNTAATVDHECRIGNYSHISVGAHLAGNVEIGMHTWVGIGAVVNNNVSICSETMIGAGAVVVRTIEEKGTFIGVPAMRINHENTDIGKQ